MITDIRLQPKMTTALEVAILVKAIPIEDAANLIQQYANTVAAGARIDATQDAYDRMDALMRGYMDRSISPEEYAETIHKVTEEMAQ